MNLFPGQPIKDMEENPTILSTKKDNSLDGKSNPNTTEKHLYLGQSEWYARFICQYQKAFQKQDDHKCLTGSSTTSHAQTAQTSLNSPKIPLKKLSLKTIAKWCSLKLKRFIAKDQEPLS